MQSQVSTKIINLGRKQLLLNHNKQNPIPCRWLRPGLVPVPAEHPAPAGAGCAAAGGRWVHQVMGKVVGQVVGQVVGRVHRSRGEFAKVIKSIRYAQENWVSTMLNTNITFILAKNDGNHVAFWFENRVQLSPSSPPRWLRPRAAAFGSVHSSYRFCYPIRSILHISVNRI